MYKRPVSSFDDELWIMIEKCEKIGLITIEFLLPWDEGFEGEMFKSSMKNKDMIHEEFMKFIFENREEELDENHRTISSCIKSFLQYTIYPKFQTEIREDLIRKSGNRFNINLIMCCKHSFDYIFLFTIINSQNTIFIKKMIK